MRLGTKRVMRSIHLTMRYGIPMRRFKHLNNVIPSPSRMVATLGRGLVGWSHVGVSLVEGVLGVLFVTLTLTTIVACFVTDSFGMFVCIYTTTVFLGLVRFFVQFVLWTVKKRAVAGRRVVGPRGLICGGPALVGSGPVRCYPKYDRNIIRGLVTRIVRRVNVRSGAVNISPMKYTIFTCGCLSVS